MCKIIHSMWDLDGKAIGERVKSAREYMGWSQRKLADRAGVSHEYVSKLEKGTFKRPTRDKIEPLADALRVSYEELMYGIEPTQQPMWPFLLDFIKRVQLRDVDEARDTVTFAIGFMEGRYPELKEPRVLPKEHEP